jgi:inward rectifier potassium channel
MEHKRKVKEDEVQAAEDSGFGLKFVGSERLIKPDGTYNIMRKNIVSRSAYEVMIHLPWLKFFLITFAVFLGINFIFAILYTLNGVENLNIAVKSPIQNYLNSLYFSIQTFTSVGYGSLNPQDNISNLISSINAFTGLFCFALATGMFFARFSKPRVNIFFSENFITSPFQDGNSIQFRLVNANNNTLLQMQASSNLTWVETDSQGAQRRKFHRLKLELDFIYLFPLNWTLVHKIDKDSPFWGQSKEELVAKRAELMVFVRGFDDTYGDFIYKNYSYLMHQMQENMVFLPMYITENGQNILDVDKINDKRPV